MVGRETNKKKQHATGLRWGLGLRDKGIWRCAFPWNFRRFFDPFPHTSRLHTPPPPPPMHGRERGGAKAEAKARGKARVRARAPATDEDSKDKEADVRYVTDPRCSHASDAIGLATN